MTLSCSLRQRSVEGLNCDTARPLRQRSLEGLTCDTVPSPPSEVCGGADL